MHKDAWEFNEENVCTLYPKFTLSHPQLPNEVHVTFGGFNLEKRVCPLNIDGDTGGWFNFLF